jgi:hypothetical protein
MTIHMNGWLCKDCSDVSYADFVKKDENKTLHKQTIKCRKVRVSCGVMIVNYEFRKELEGRCCDLF